MVRVEALGPGGRVIREEHPLTVLHELVQVIGAQEHDVRCLRGDPLEGLLVPRGAFAVDALLGSRSRS